MNAQAAPGRLSELATGVSSLPAAETLGRATVEGCSFTAPNEVQFTLRNTAGERYTFTTSTAMLGEMVVMLTTLVNSAPANILRDTIF